VRQLVIAATLVAIASCGARSTERATTPQIGVTESEVSGVTVIARERAGSGHVAASLSVRVRAEPLALATAAALIVEERSGGRLHARATPDGITVHTTAAIDALDEVVAMLARALAVRDPSADEVAHAIERIHARRAGRANDEHARAARLAVAALFGEELDALGTADDDARITTESVAALFRSTFGVERALVAIVGDVAPQAVESAVARSFGGADHVAPDETATWTAREDVHVEISDRDVISVAAVVSDLDEAERAAGWVSWADPSATVSAFPLRGASVLVVVRDGDVTGVADLAARVRHSAIFAERWARAVAPDVASELAALDDAWLARGTAPEGHAIAVGLLAAGGRDDEETGDDARATELRAHALSSLRERPRTSSEPAGDTVLTSGARLRLRRVAGGTLAVALSFDAGAVLDPRAEHGRTALFAALLGRSCEPDADVSWVDARSFGLVVSGEPASLEHTVARAVDCVRRAAREAAHAEGVRADAIARLDDAARARSWAATAISPGTPGLVAPHGSAVGIAAASGLETTLAAILSPARATLVILGDVDPAHAAAVTDALTSELPRGATVADANVGDAAGADVFIADPVVRAPEVIVTLRSDSGESAAAARATARALADALTTEGAVVEFWLGDAALGTSFVAVGVRGDDALLDSLPARMADRIAALDASEGLEAAVEADAARRALASPLDVARAMASAEPVGDPAAVVAGLLAATPRYVMLRPSAGPLHPARRR
jgi:hypothetical protein